MIDSSQRATVASYCLCVPSSLIVFAMTVEVIRSSETSVLISATLRKISEDGILHCCRREDLNISLTFSNRVPVAVDLGTHSRPARDQAHFTCFSDKMRSVSLAVL
jgi:hypothetical protein